MPLEQTDLKYIWDMLDAAKTVVELTQRRTHVPALIAQLQPIIDAHPIDELPGSNS